MKSVQQLTALLVLATLAISCANPALSESRLGDKQLRMLGMVIETKAGEFWVPINDEALKYKEFAVDGEKTTALASEIIGEGDPKESFDRKISKLIKKLVAKENECRLFQDGRFERPKASLLESEGTWKIEGKQLLRLADKKTSLSVSGIRLPIAGSDSYQARLHKDLLLLRDADVETDVWTVFKLVEF